MKLLHKIALLVIMILMPYRSLAEGGREEASLTLGFILPLSGDAVTFGESVKNGALLAHSELSPIEQRKIKLIFEDDGFQAARSVGAFRKLLEIDHAHGIVAAGSNSGLALAPLAEAAGIPLIAIASDARIVENRKFAVNLWVTPEAEAEAAASEIKNRGYKTMARVSSQHAFSEAVNRAFDARTAGSIEAVLDQEVPLDARDFRQIIARIAAIKRVDAVCPVLMPGQVGVFARQLREMGVQAPLFGFEFFEDPREVEASRGVLIGAWYVNGRAADSEFLARFSRRFPAAPSFAAANGHDAVRISVLAAGKSPPSAVLNHVLHSLRDFDGALGRYSASGSNTFTLPAAVKVVEKDGFREVN